MPIEKVIYNIDYLFKMYLRSRVAVVVASPEWLLSQTVVFFGT